MYPSCNGKVWKSRTLADGKMSGELFYRKMLYYHLNDYGECMV